MRPLSRWYWWTVLLSVWVATTAQTASPGADLRYRLSLDRSRLERFVGDDQVGDVRTNSARFYLDNAKRIRLLALEVEQNENRVPDSVGLDLPVKSMNFGVDQPMGRHCDLTMAGSILTSQSSEDYWAVGLYPSYGDTFALALGLENDQEGHLLQYGFVRQQYRYGRLFLGASDEKIPPAHGSPEETIGRISGATIVSPGDSSLIECFGGLTSAIGGKPTWMGGFAKVADLDSTAAPINPACFLVVRQKPEAFYLLGLATLYGTTLNQYVCPGIFQAMYRGSLNQSRIVRNSNFGTIGVGGGYDAQDFGRVSLAATVVSIEAGSATLREEEYAAYGTLPATVLGLTNPYVGFSYSRSTDLTYDPAAREFDDPQHDWYTASLGVKIRWIDRPDPRRRSQYGFARFDLAVRFQDGYEGISISSTVWY